MRHVIITGGSRGIGFGLTREFLRMNYRVTFTGTSDSSVNNASEKFSEEFDPDNFRGMVCDVTIFDDLKTLWEFSTSIFGPVDIWINNAGLSNPSRPFNELENQEFIRVVDVNIKGVMQATHLAFNRMSAQGYGAIYNMGGLGSDGRMIKGLTPYGMSKRAVQYFTKAFARETKESPVITGMLLPGMVLTDLILEPIRKDPAGTRGAARVFNLLAEEVDTVAQFLVPRIIENSSTGKVISYLSFPRMMQKIFTRPFSSENLVKKHL